MKKNLLMISLIWLVLICASFMWNYMSQKYEQAEIARRTAQTFFNQIVIARSWNALHGGVYVPVTNDTKPNPYLEDPMRDIVVNKDLTLTKVNPAFMTRQIGKLSQKSHGAQFNITSLKPIRPANTPSPKEKEALDNFEKGDKEVSFFFEKDGKEYFFYMAPLLTSTECLKCHAKQGYKEGDVRGGISVTLPFVPNTPITALVLGHLFIGLAGVAGILLMGGRLNKAYQTIHYQAVMDALTGIPNRRNFRETLVKEFRRCQRNQKPLSLIMSDIDFFKGYNDTYGHAEGDNCLKEIAQAINSSLARPGDFCARYGGEEFVIILPDTTHQGATHLAEKIRRNVQDLHICHAGPDHQKAITLSLGVATAMPGTSMDHEDLLKLADDALYRAKANGRNRVESAPQS